METRFLDELHKKIAELIAASPAKDIEKNLRALLSSAFSRLDLVTREEFDVQQEVLGRTRDKLHEMEARVAEIEKSLAGLGSQRVLWSPSPASDFSISATTTRADFRSAGRVTRRLIQPRTRRNGSSSGHGGGSSRERSAQLHDRRSARGRSQREQGPRSIGAAELPI